ncbi:Lin-54-like protein [Dorcoceras hygrometricum]|uniref:Lin-54-like protein n=1 Tax=Dorcoceras hygrometricum TaxID=472368 RepID=A0A2Z6ZZ50_9LAMI|nr:Lin-54-like protein [Dorcoceras hygrometricum]
MSGKESNNSVDLVPDDEVEILPTPVIYLDSDDEVEVLPTPPKRRNEQPVGESSGIKKDPKEQPSPAKEKEKDVDTKDKGQNSE